jgi:DNA polymerase I-like protein with 3'-5' exonuclease and polymerase domains
MSFVTQQEYKEEYLVLQPGKYLARTGDTHGIIFNPELHDLRAILDSIRESKIVAVDFETRGGDYTFLPTRKPEHFNWDNPDAFRIVGLGLAWDSGSVYFDWNTLDWKSKSSIQWALSNHNGCIAHNVMFDGGVTRLCFDPGKDINWHACTFALYSLLANEGYAGRGWGLKTAQVELLGWENSNEVELDRWLVVNQYYKGNPRLDNSYEYLNAEFEAGKLKPNKEHMWRAPTDILGHYCILDAESCYLLYNHVLMPAAQQFDGFLEVFSKYWMGLISTSIDQKIHGIPVDRPKLVERKNHLLAAIAKADHDFITHSDVMSHIQDMEFNMRKAGILDKEPAQFKKNGEQSKNWEKWAYRLDLAERRQLPEYCFNLNSGPQLRELVYTRLKHPVRMETEKGEPSVSYQALTQIGGVFSIVTKRMDDVKELGFIEKYLELTEHRPTIHPSFKVPGTVSGRLSSNNPNLQQMKKTKAMMSLFVARPDTVWIDLDFSALEPCVTTEYSQDDSMMRIYGPEAKNGDIYCYVMANVPGMAEKAKELGYDPLNPTKEGLAAVKKQMKKERQICKAVVLACAYGAGAKKIHQTLEEQDVHLPFEEVQKIYNTYWETFEQVKDFEKTLFYQWKRNKKRYVINGIGRPMAVPEMFNKDLLNRFIQSTGHDILLMYIDILKSVLLEWNIEWKPIICDFHDATTIEVSSKDAERGVAAFNEAMDRLNKQLNGTVKLKGIPVVGTNLAECKEPDQ